jgi:hypothetical protein
MLNVCSVSFPGLAPQPSTDMCHGDTVTGTASGVVTPGYIYLRNHSSQTCLDCCWVWESPSPRPRTSPPSPAFVSMCVKERAPSASVDEQYGGQRVVHTTPHESLRIRDMLTFKVDTGCALLALTLAARCCSGRGGPACSGQPQPDGTHPHHCSQWGGICGCRRPHGSWVRGSYRCLWGLLTVQRLPVL